MDVNDYSDQQRFYNVICTDEKLQTITHIFRIKKQIDLTYKKTHW